MIATDFNTFNQEQVQEAQRKRHDAIAELIMGRLQGLITESLKTCLNKNVAPFRTEQADPLGDNNGGFWAEWLPEGWDEPIRIGLYAVDRSHRTGWEFEATNFATLDSDNTPVNLGTIKADLETATDIAYLASKVLCLMVQVLGTK